MTRLRKCHHPRRALEDERGRGFPLGREGFTMKKARISRFAFSLGAAIIASSALAPLTYAQEDPGGRAEHRSDPCDRLPDAQGRAEGHDKCRGGSSSGVARGDFNGDGFADLAVGVPGKNTPASVGSSGAVYVIYGSANGLLPAGGTGIPATQFWSQNTPGVPDASEEDDHFGSALAAGEFNGDAFADLAIGIPGEDFDGIDDSGRVVVIYGSENGLTATDLAVTAPRAFDLRDFCPGAGCIFGDEDLGSALTWGDFDGDGFGDLAIGIRGYVVAPVGGFHSEAGAVWVLFGEEGTGLTAQGTRFFTQDSPGVRDVSEARDRFGSVLTAGDFNGDGRTDLAITAPDEDFGGVADVGVVHVFFGADDGFRLDNDRLFSMQDFEGLTGFIEVAAPDDEFGSSLAAGDFDGDGRADLAIGAPDRDVGTSRSAGMVFLYSTTNAAAGVLGTKRFFHQNYIVTSGGTESGDDFGFALAAGDFNADRFTDLAIGVPYEDVAGSGGQTIQNAGEVNVIYGSSTGLEIAFGSAQQFHQGSGGVLGTLESDDRFGMSLSAWNFGRNEQRFVGTPPATRLVTFQTADLAIGAPYEDLFAADTAATIADAGAINVLYGSVDNGLTASDDQLFFQSNIGPGFADVAIDRFGRFLY